mmetsp:Transcript_4744/g.11304  ORF Transcript_4744/g.11304 Transcript_4744/m.11304 type:complete len:122 (+) Transcript_4744:991-1356(+)
MAPAMMSRCKPSNLIENDLQRSLEFLIYMLPPTSIIHALRRTCSLLEKARQMSVNSFEIKGKASRENRGSASRASWAEVFALQGGVMKQIVPIDGSVTLHLILIAGLFFDQVTPQLEKPGF